MDHKYAAKNSAREEGKILKCGNGQYKGKRLKQKPNHPKNGKVVNKSKKIVEANKPTLPNIYKPQHKVGTKMEFLVINLMPQIKLDELSLVMNALRQYCDHAFAPVWGCSAVFQVLPFGTFPTDDQISGRALIYLADQLIDGSKNFTNAVAAHWLVMPPPCDTADADGPQPSSMIKGVPNVPPNTIIVMVPYGDLTYGLAAEMNKNQDKIINVFGIGLSHEVFETLVDPYPTGYGASYQVFVGSNYTYMYVKEVCDAVQDTLATNVNGITMSNFVYPTYFNPICPIGTQLDYNNQLTSPLTPFKGSQFGLMVDNKLGGMNLFIDVSDPVTPTNIIRYKLTEIYAPCVSRSVMRHLKESTRLFQGAHLEPFSMISQATIINRQVIDDSVIPFIFHN